MAVRLSCWLSAAAAAFVLSSGSVAARQDPSVPELLTLAGDYLSQFAQRLGAVAADEEYVQYDTSSGSVRTPKRLTGQVVWLGLHDGIVESFRDVAAIDSHPLRLKEARLLHLFTAPAAGSRAEARQITEDAVRHYVQSSLHLLDEPMLALEFLRPANQARSTFKLDGVKSTDGARVAVLKFTEAGTERLIPSPDKVAAIGRFWIDAASGAVRQTELGLGGPSYNFHAEVTYAPDGASTFWLPAEMVQRCQLSRLGSTYINHMGANGGYNARQDAEARATYANYRHVAVDLSKLR